MTEAAHAQHTPPRGVGPLSPESGGLLTLNSIEINTFSNFQTLKLLFSAHSVQSFMHFHSPWSPDADCEPLGGGGAGADGVRSEPLGLEHGEELVTGAQGPRVSAISHQQQPQ